MEREIYRNLINWKENKIKMPYMLVGVRQTGKTYIITEFCKNEFENYIYINLDNMREIAQIFEQTIEPDRIIENIEAILNTEIDINNTINIYRRNTS